MNEANQSLFLHNNENREEMHLQPNGNRINVILLIIGEGETKLQ